MRIESNKSKMWDSPGGPVVKNLPVNAGDTGSIPGPGRSHMPLGNQALVMQLLKPGRLEPRLCNRRSHGNEEPKHRSGSNLYSPRPENAHVPQRRPSTAKNKLINNNKKKKNKTRLVHSQLSEAETGL